MREHDGEGEHHECGGEGEHEDDFTLEDLQWACENMDQIPEEHHEDLQEVCNFAADAAVQCEEFAGQDEFKECMKDALFSEFGDMHL